MERSRRGANRADAAKATLAALAAGRESGKKRAETFEVEKEDRVYDEVWARFFTASVLDFFTPRAFARARSWMISNTAPLFPSGAKTSAASWSATRTPGAPFFGFKCAERGPALGALKRASRGRRYQDIGEEEDWTTAAREEEEEEGADPGEGAAPADKRKRQGGPQARARPCRPGAEPGAPQIRRREPRPH